MFNVLLKAIDALPVVPVVGGDRARLHLVLDDDLARLVTALVKGDVEPPGEPTIVAHPDSLSFRQILERLADLRDRRVTMVPFPWQAAWLGLFTIEHLAPGMGLRSDSVVSLLSQEDHPKFPHDLLDRIGMTSLDAFVAEQRRAAQASK